MPKIKTAGRDPGFPENLPGLLWRDAPARFLTIGPHGALPPVGGLSPESSPVALRLLTEIAENIGR